MLCCIMAMPIYCETCALTWRIVIGKQVLTPVKCTGAMPHMPRMKVGNNNNNN